MQARAPAGRIPGRAASAYRLPAAPPDTDDIVMAECLDVDELSVYPLLDGRNDRRYAHHGRAGSSVGSSTRRADARRFGVGFESRPGASILSPLAQRHLRGQPQLRRGGATP